MGRATRGWLLGQLLIWGLGAVALRLVIVPSEHCPPVTRPEIRRAIDSAAAWLQRSVQPDGRYLYAYDRRTRRVSTDYNVVRHVGVMDALYRTGHLGAGDAGLGYVKANLLHRDGWTAFTPPTEHASAGAAALLVVALLHRRELTGDHGDDALLRGLARFLVEQTRPDGSVLLEYDQQARRPVPGVFGLYSTGEAFYALAFMASTFPGEGWDRPARRIVAYIATRRHQVEGTAYREPDHWAAYGLAELGRLGPLSSLETSYARWEAGAFGFEVRFVAQHTGRNLFAQDDSGARLGVRGEGIAALRRLIDEDPGLRDLDAGLRERQLCLAGVLVDRQAPASDPDPLARGAWFSDDETRMDDQQHSIAALLGAERALP
jgi:hypothetical protein